MMNSGFALVAVVSLFAFSSCVSGQDANAKAGNSIPDFSGTWILDISRSKFVPGQAYESMTLTVAQSQREIRVDTAAKLVPADPAFMGGPVRRSLDRNTSNTYSLEQKETRGEIAGPAGPMPATLTASVDANKLHLRQTLTSDSPIASNETWELADAGKTLTIERETGGSRSLLVFSKKS
jgi:hypothetical protein